MVGPSYFFIYFYLSMHLFIYLFSFCCGFKSMSACFVSRVTTVTFCMVVSIYAVFACNFGSGLHDGGYVRPAYSWLTQFWYLVLSMKL